VVLTLRDVDSLAFAFAMGFTVVVLCDALKVL
jgi:acid phosphatase family membrane protein YuiD